MRNTRPAAKSSLRKRTLLCRLAGSRIESLETRALMAADLVISEFLASNQTGLTDKFGDKSDWIEIYNRGDATANLGDYYLTDDAAAPTKWHFPAQDLAAGRYLIVFASDRNLAVAGQQLHTNFKLSAGGEYLGLMRSDGTAKAEFAPTFPAQTSDVSFGLTDETNTSSTAVQFFSTPSPGAQNTPGAAAPVFSTPAKVFTGPFQLTISSPTPGAQIRYTLDRSTPTEASPLYTGPLTISNTTMVRAKVFASGFLPSGVTSQSYVRVDSTVSGFNTNLGTVVVDTYGTGLNDTSYVLGSGTFIDNDDANGRADITDTPDYMGRIGIRIRGSTSSTFPKVGYAVELWDENNNDRKASLLGMPADSDWILYAPYSEKSLMQNALAYKWANEMGQYATRTRFVELYLNTDGGTAINYSSDYWGVYMLVEKIKISDDRINIAETSPNDTTEPAITGGYVWKKDRQDADETSVHTNQTNQDWVLVEPETLNTSQRAWLTSYLNSFETALYGGNFKDVNNGYAKYIDVDSFVDYWLTIEMTKQIDGFRLSTFYYKDRGGKIHMGPVWDFNLSMGNADYMDGFNPTGWYSDQLSNAEYPYFRRLFQDPAFKQRVTDRWSELRQTVFKTSAIMSDVDANVATLTDGNGNYPVGQFPSQASNNPVVRNYKRWNILGTYYWPNGFYSTAGKWIEDVEMMKGWLAGRVAWMDSQLLPGPVSSGASGFITGSKTVTLTPNRVTNTDTTLVATNAPLQAWVPTGSVSGWQNLTYTPGANWKSGVGGVGYDQNTTGSGEVNFLPYVGMNVQSDMQGKNQSIYIRIPFNVSDPSAIQSLILRMRYDDGFIAYLNGQPITSRYSPSSTFNAYNAGANGSRNDAATLTPEEIDVSAFKNLLVSGTNVLAIQGLNSGVNSSDFLIQPELVARARVTPSAFIDTSVYYTLDGSDPLMPDGTTLNPAAILYTGPITIGATATVRSRSLRAGAWSGLSEQYYVVGTDALRISEVMYNPAAGGSFATQEYEYIEVQNTGTVPLNLKGYTFSDGVDFTFGDVTLAPGAYGVIVKNLEAFQSRYGTSVNTLGTYTGSLDNAGEHLELTNPFGQVSQAFAYDPTWYASTNGGGASLEAVGMPGTLDGNLATSWHAATASPGVVGDTTAPTGTWSYLWNSSPDTITIAFDEALAGTIELGDFTVVNLTTGATLTPTGITYDAATHLATLTLNNGSVLADGNYRVTLAGTHVRDTAGNAAATQTFDFYVLAGDLDRDRDVDFADLLTLAKNYNQSGKPFSLGNLDYSSDGLVSFSDLLILAKSYNKTLTAAPLPAAAATATTSTTRRRTFAATDVIA